MTQPEKDVYQWNRELSKVPPAAPKTDRPPKKSGRYRHAILVAIGALTIVGVAVASAAFRPAPPAAAAPAMGRLTLNTRPAGASIAIDGAMKGVSPLTIELAAGSHRIEVRHGDELRELPIAIGPGERFSQYIEFQSTPATGKLQIESDPPGARVMVDGEARGVSPVTVEGLVPGVHAVVLQGEGGAVERSVTVGAGATAFLFMPLVAKGALSGSIAIASPVALQIFEGGRLIGTTASERVMMTVGRHEIQLTNETLGYSENRVVTVSPGRTTSIAVEMPPGVLHVNATPWAEVTIDGRRMGETPLGNLRLPIGEHDVVFRHPQFGEQRHVVTVTLNTPARLSVNLSK